MVKLKIKKGDKVKIIAGNHKGKVGSVIKVIPNKAKLIVEGINIVSRSLKPSSTNPKGGVIKKEMPIHISNVALFDQSNNKTTKVGYKFDENDKKYRYSKVTNEKI